MILNLFPVFDFETVRIPGVLQRIALVFLFSAILFLTNSARSLVLISISILVLYCALMNLVPIPGGIAPNLEPTTNIGAWLDNIVLNGHLWAHSKTWDPEGLVSTLPAIVSGLIGVLTGLWLKQEIEVKEKLLKLSIAANVLIVVALAWNMSFPINKSLWTSSFVLITSGIAMHTLVFSFWVIDIKKYTKGTGVFMAFGSNAISAYMLSELLANLMYSIKFMYKGSQTSLKGFVFELFSFDFVDPQLTSLVLALMWVALIYIPISILYKNKLFIKV